MRISLILKKGGKGHEDLILRIDDRQWICDSYYLGLDGAMEPEQQTAEKARRVLRRLLEQWRDAIAGPKSTFFLAFDFSDQSTSWLKCWRVGTEVIDIQPGWSRLEGWAFNPSESAAYIDGPPDFHPDGAPVSFTREELLDCVSRSMEQA